jgi:tetratricopeptide (TPR) repeat protein
MTLYHLIKPALTAALILSVICGIIAGPTVSSADSIRKALFRTDNAADQVRLYISLSETFQGKNLDSVTFCLRKALGLAQSLNLLQPLGEVYHALGNNEVIQNNLDQALHDFKLALIFFDKAKNPDKVARMHLLIGNIYFMKDDAPRAMNYYMEGIAISEQNKLNPLLAHFNNNMGLIFQEADDLQNSLNYLQKSVQNFKDCKDSVNMADAILNIGWIYYFLGNYEMAKNYAEKARQIFSNANEDLRVLMAIMLLGTATNKQGKYSEALQLMNRCLELQNHTRGTYKGPKNYILSELYMWTGSVYIGISDYVLAKSYLRKGLKLAVGQHQPRIIMRASEFLSNIYQKTGQPDSALYYFKMFHANSDSLSKAMSVNSIKLVAIQKDFDKKQKENELKLGFERTKRRNILIIYLISGVIFIGVIIILFLMLKLQRQKEKQAEIEKAALDEKLEFQNKEMTTNVMYLNKMNEQVLMIAEKLRQFQIEEGSPNAKIIRSIITDLEQGSGSVTWKEFEVRFQNVHKDFYKNLIEKYPDLTPNELKLCAFLRLNMSTKDISAITYQSENSITVARTRLRQKLEISRQENLVAYLSQF